MNDTNKLDPQAVISFLIEIFTEIPKIFEANDKEIERRDYERTDLDHLIELTSFGGVQGFKLAKMIQENRQRRREAKDQNIMLRPLYEFILKNQNFGNQLYKVQMDTMKQIKAMNERMYHPRTDHPAVLAVFGREDGEMHESTS